MKLKLLLFTIFLFSIGVSAQTAKLGKSFQLNVANKQQLKSTKLNVEFVSVIEDSRCPPNAECIWAGKLVVKLKLWTNTKKAKTIELDLQNFPVQEVFEGFKIAVESASPKESQGLPEKFALTIKVTKSKGK